MADVAGIGNETANSFGVNATRSVPEDRSAAENGALLRSEDDAAQQADTATPRDGFGGATEALPADRGTAAGTDTATSTDRSGAGAEAAARETQTDTVSLSRTAEEALAAPGTEQTGVPAADEATTFAGATRETNQVVREENSTSEVNGNQDGESESSRSLGQVVDQFA